MVYERQLRKIGSGKLRRASGGGRVLGLTAAADLGLRVAGEVLEVESDGGPARRYGWGEGHVYCARNWG